MAGPQTWIRKSARLTTTAGPQTWIRKSAPLTTTAGPQTWIRKSARLTTAAGLETWIRKPAPTGPQIRIRNKRNSFTMAAAPQIRTRKIGSRS